MILESKILITFFIFGCVLKEVRKSVEESDGYASDLWSIGSGFCFSISVISFLWIVWFR